MPSRPSRVVVPASGPLSRSHGRHKVGVSCVPGARRLFVVRDRRTHEHRHMGRSGTEGA